MAGSYWDLLRLYEYICICLYICMCITYCKHNIKMFLILRSLKCCCRCPFTFPSVNLIQISVVRFLAGGVRPSQLCAHPSLHSPPLWGQAQVQRVRQAQVQEGGQGQAQGARAKVARLPGWAQGWLCDQGQTCSAQLLSDPQWKGD